MEPQILIAPPEADFVLIVSASWWLWAALALVIVITILSFALRAKK